MFGSSFWRHPDALVQSLRDMSTWYRDESSGVRRSEGLLAALQSAYVLLVGIPEVGFRLRGAYFRRGMRRLARRSPRTILDAGSGIGAYAFALARLFPGAQINGWDLDPNKVALAREIAREGHVANVKFDVRDLFESGDEDTRYDLVVSIDVLEHIHDHHRALQRMHSVLRPGGFLYLHTPQPDQQRIFNQFRTWEHEDHEHEGFTRPDLVNELTSIGFAMVDVRETFGLPGRLAWELNHIALLRSQLLAGLTFPVLQALASLDNVTPKRNALGTAILARKPGSAAVTPRSN